MKFKTDEEILTIIQSNVKLSSSNIAVLAGYKPTPKICSRIVKIAKSNKIILSNDRKGMSKCRVCNTQYRKNVNQYGPWICCSKKCYHEYLIQENIKPKLTTGKIKRINKVKQQKCIICSHDTIVEVHHINCDKHDHRETNMVCLCANHHKMVHLSKYHNEIQIKIDDYMHHQYGDLYDYKDNDKFYCFDKQTNKIHKRPTKETLINDINKMSLSEISRTYKVNIATIYKWIKYYGIKRHG